MALVGNGQAALAFLRWARPAGPWVLTAINPDRSKPTRTDTFTVDQEQEVLAWLAGHDGVMNCYWMVNSARTALKNKASKEDVESMDFLHVDLDPTKGKALETERPGLLARLEAFQPEPSAIVDSGGGFQAFWRLEEPFYIGGDLVRVADAEAYNQQLEILLGGDHCHNLDRIMRLPGTINVPNDKKIAAGRRPALASAVELTDRVYGLAHFLPAPRVQTGNGKGAHAGAKPLALGNLQPVSMEELPEQVTQRTRTLIIQGDDPEDQTKYSSRSEVVWAVLCSLVRAGCKPEMIASILLDPDYGISEHVRKQPRPQAYVERQLHRAREEVEEPMLRKLNEYHAVIADLGGKCRIVSEVVDASMEQSRTRLSKQSFEDFRNRYCNVRVQVGKDAKDQPIYKPAGAWWLTHPMRRQYDSLVFAPGREVAGAYNLWQGFACEAIPGANHEPFLQHVHENICSGDAAHYAYLLGWMARAVQRPGQPGEVAVILRGGEGTGKGVFFRGFGSLWGRHYLQISNAKHLVGQFNSHLRDCVFLYADEAFYAGDKQHESILKTLVTEDTFMAEAKGVDAEVAPNYVHLGMSSNGNWVVPAGGDARRYAVLDVGEGHKQDAAYFREVRRALDGGGREALLHYLMTYDISEYEVRNAPKTEALRDQKLLSLGAEEQWFLERLFDGRTTAAHNDWRTDLLKDAMHGDYLRYAEGQRIMRRVSPIALGRFLNRVMPGDWPRSTQRMTTVEKPNGDGQMEKIRERAYWYELPPLDVCRAEWEKKYGVGWAWPKDGTDAPTQTHERQREPY